jgi:hypothetical protein
MKVLLDENVPRQLKFSLTEFETYTVPDQGWNGASNGDLLQLMISEGFDLLITFDKSLQFQQNFEKFTIPVIIIQAPRNTMQEILPLIGQIKAVIQSGALRIGINAISA